MSRCLLVPALVVVAVASIAAPALADDEPQFAARHVLVTWKGAQHSQATRSRNEAWAVAQKALAALRAPAADFAAVSHELSDDRWADADGGFLGWFDRSSRRMSDAFVDAVERLAEGQTSGVVETPLGFHVIQRLSRADGDALLDRTKPAIVSALFPWKGLANATRVVRSKETALDDATKAMEHLRAGGSFDALRSEWGAVPFVPGWGARVLAPTATDPAERALLEQVKAMKPLEVSRPAETAAGWLVVRRVPHFRFHLQHLVVLFRGSAAADPTVRRSRDEARARAAEALKRFEADPASWARVVGEFSEEENAGPRQGDLGWVEPGSGVGGAFEDAAAVLRPGAHSAVFESPFGFHVVRRVD
jgi:parvulin-like peptidyl-prolyl isomerase